MASWMNNLALMDGTCPWPGPRPMRGAEVINGRDDEARTFLQLVGEHRLVILDGKSGVGKSSLLQASLVPALREKGYAVAVCSEWSDAGDMEPHDLLGGMVFNALAKEPRFGDESLPKIDTFSRNADLFDELETDRELHSRKTVVILDQFEELIRFSPGRASKIIDVLAMLNNQSSLNVVVSLRSEYLHELRKLERIVKAFTYATYELEPIGDRFAVDIIVAPNTAGSEAITADAAEALAELWRDARRLDRERPTSADEIGLLHLQAALYTLHWANVDLTHAVSLDDVKRFVGHRTASEVFENSMVSAVKRKLDLCKEATGDFTDPYLLRGTRAYVARIAPHLSSGGFKLHREAEELARQTIDDELESLGADRNTPGWPVLLRQMVALATQSNDHNRAADSADLIGDNWYELVRKLQGIERADELLREMDAELDPDSRSSGAMMGMPHPIVLIEELRRLAMAMAWMTHSHLVRMTNPAHDQTMISLIHDRFGVGLSKWSDEARNLPAAPIYAITAPQAGNFIWRKAPDLIGIPGKAKMIANLRWRGAFIKADFSHVVLANCDFRGTMFKECSFEGVAFVNCRLEGTMFEACRVVGHDSPPLSEKDDRPSSFALDVKGLDVAELTESLPRYSLATDESSSLWSYLPGRPVELLAEDDMQEASTKITTWAPPLAGLVIYGGRISSLVCRGMTFEGDDPLASAVAFRHVSGAGLDIAEQADSGSFEIFASAVRHLSITPERRVAEDHPFSSVEVSITGSAVAQTWFGENLAGKARCVDSLLIHMWNNSTAFEVSVHKCSYQGLVGCDEATESDPFLPGEPVIAAVKLNGRIVDRTKVMNFVQDPSRTT